VKVKLADFNHLLGNSTFHPPKKDGKDSQTSPWYHDVRPQSVWQMPTGKNPIRTRVFWNEESGENPKQINWMPSVVVRLGIFGIFVAGTHICNVVQVQHLEHVSFLKG